MRVLTGLMTVFLVLGGGYAATPASADTPGVFIGVMSAPCDARWHIVTRDLPAGSRLVLHLGPESTPYEDLPPVAAVPTTGAQVEWLELSAGVVTQCESDGGFRGRSLVIAYDARGYNIAEHSSQAFLVSTRQRDAGPQLEVTPDSGRCDQLLTVTASGLVAGRDYILMVRPAVIGPGSGGATSGTAEGRAGPDGTLELPLNRSAGLVEGPDFRAWESFRATCESSAFGVDSRTLLTLSMRDPSPGDGLPPSILFARTQSSLTPWPPPERAETSPTAHRDMLGIDPNPRVAPLPSRPADQSQDGGSGLGSAGAIAVMAALVVLATATTLYVARRTH